MTINKQVLGSLEVENKRPSNQGLKITSNFLEGKISSNQAIKSIKEVYGV